METIPSTKAYSDVVETPGGDVISRADADSSMHIIRGSFGAHTENDGNDASYDAWAEEADYLAEAAERAAAEEAAQREADIAAAYGRVYGEEFSLNQAKLESEIALLVAQHDPGIDMANVATDLGLDNSRIRKELSSLATRIDELQRTLANLRGANTVRKEYFFGKMNEIYKTTNLEHRQKALAEFLAAECARRDNRRRV